MKVAVLGAGSWGTALSIHLARGGHDVLLWGRDTDFSDAVERTRLHPRRLAGAPMPAGLRTTSDLESALVHSDTAVVAVACAGFRPLFSALPGAMGSHRYLSVAKGIEPETLKRMSEIILEFHPSAEVAALSGPTFADGVARGDPSAAVVAGGGLARDLQREFSSPLFRLYSSEDLVGVELAGALKNVVAIAAGIVSGLGFGHNTLAALVTRGLAEIGRIVRASGGQERTIAGLAGIGDLMLTCTGRESRNRRVGEEIGRGRSLPEVLAEMPEVAEGVRTCLAMPKIAAAAGVEAPIAEAVRGVLYEGSPPREAVERLMTRALKSE
ncbi:MAG TPA: NAD(P)H-dependent glycerol-3-phosphate dehydrogenase [Thermoanaerobaculia bacterium]|nr:NAD(P)H-dependent glycerol-3-phosphate dehydrogenase [Thermoanaerobaculia bacterium]